MAEKEKSVIELDNLCNDCRLADTCTDSLKGLTTCKTTKCFRREWAKMEVGKK